MGWEVHAIATFAGHRSHGLDAALYPPVRPGPGGEAELLDDADPCLAGADAHRPRHRRSRRRRGMNAGLSPAAEGAGRVPWSSGISDQGWDRSRELLDAEAAAIAAIGPVSLRRNRATGVPRRTARHWHAISRLAVPLDAARDALRHDDDVRFRRAGAQAAAIVLQHCADTGRTYWAWTPWDWAGLCGSGARDFLAARTLPTESTVRPFLVAAGLPARRVHRLPPAGQFQPPAPGRAGLRRGCRRGLDSAGPRGSSTSGATGTRCARGTGCAASSARPC